MLLETKIIKDDGYQKQQGKPILLSIHDSARGDPWGAGAGGNKWHDRRCAPFGFAFYACR